MQVLRGVHAVLQETSARTNEQLVSLAALSRAAAAALQQEREKGSQDARRMALAMAELKQEKARLLAALDTRAALPVQLKPSLSSMEGEDSDNADAYADVGDDMPSPSRDFSRDADGGFEYSDSFQSPQQLESPPYAAFGDTQTHANTAANPDAYSGFDDFDSAAPAAASSGFDDFDSAAPAAASSGFDDFDSAAPAAASSGFDDFDSAAPAAASSGFDDFDSAAPAAASSGFDDFGPAPPLPSSAAPSSDFNQTPSKPSKPAKPSKNPGPNNDDPFSGFD